MNHLNGKNEEDRRIYERSARLILLLALRDIAPGTKARFEHSIGLGIYLNVSGVSLTASLVRKIEARMREISKADLPIVKSRWTREQAVAYFRAQGQEEGRDRWQTSHSRRTSPWRRPASGASRS